MISFNELKKLTGNVKDNCIAFKELKKQFATEIEKPAKRRKNNLTLEDIQEKVTSERILKRLQRVIKERGMICNPNHVREVIDRVLMTPVSEIVEYVGEFTEPFDLPFSTLDVVTGFIGPYSEDARLIDSLTMAAWYSMNFTGEENAPCGVINKRELRFARGFREVFQTMKQDNDWFKLLDYITMNDLVTYLNSLADGKRKLPDFVYPNGTVFEYEDIIPEFAVPELIDEDLATVGGVLEGMEDYFGSWDPGACPLSKYGERVEAGCRSMTSLINMIVTGYYDINERIEFYKSHSKSELPALIREEALIRQNRLTQKAG